MPLESCLCDEIHFFLVGKGRLDCLCSMIFWWLLGGVRDQKVIEIDQFCFFFCLKYPELYQRFWCLFVLFENNN